MKTALTYEKFVHDNYEYLKTFCDKHVYVAYAGGKDASVILHFFTRAKEEFGFEFETHAGMYPLHVYTNDDVDKLDSYCNRERIHARSVMQQKENIFLNI